MVYILEVFTKDIAWREKRGNTNRLMTFSSYPVRPKSLALCGNHNLSNMFSFKFTSIVSFWYPFVPMTFTRKTSWMSNYIWQCDNTLPCDNSWSGQAIAVNNKPKITITMFIVMFVTLNLQLWHVILIKGNNVMLVIPNYRDPVLNILGIIYSNQLQQCK